MDRHLLVSVASPVFVFKYELVVSNIILGIIYIYIYYINIYILIYIIVLFGVNRTTSHDI